MGGKHLKRLRAEKSKVHLKKKKLAKGQNITDTTFKVKKILTVEQLKKVDKDEPVSNWNIPLKDLLIKLNHYNMTSRLNSLNGIKEILTNYPEILHGPSLKPLISKLLDLLPDEEHKVRVTAIEMLSYLFSLIPSTALLPFHGILNVHLGCAMTHRDASVQRDSLKLIHVIIKYSPEALKQNFWSIAQNFIRILKKLLNESHELPSKGGKTNVEKLKEEMFSGFYSFLSATSSNLSSPKIKYFPKNIHISNSGCEAVPLRQSENQYKQTPNLSLLFTNTQKKHFTFNENSFQEFSSLSSLVIPLLSETWLEFCPEKRFNGTSFECVLSEGTANLLCVLLKIFLFFYERAFTLGGTQMEQWFIESYSSSFKKCFLTNFPYFIFPTRKKENLKKSNEFVDTSSDSSILHNLIIFYLSYSFKCVSDNHQLGMKMENYLSWVLTKKNFTHLEILSKVIKIILKKSNESKERRRRILKKVINAYKGIQRSEVRRELSKVLLKVALEEDEEEEGVREEEREEEVSDWMKSLPEQLCRGPVDVEVIEAVRELLGRQWGGEVLREVERRALEILNKMDVLEVEGAEELEGQKMIANILYRCNNKVLEEILKGEILKKSSFSQSFKDYITNIFSHKLLTL